MARPKRNNFPKSSKTEVKKALKDALPEHYFILVTGVPIKNIKELMNSFDTMNEWVFNHHVNSERNDFTNWISEVFEEKELADEIRGIKQMHEMQHKMLRHLVNKYL
ncbi:MAG: DUF5752 family protein [archaeon]